MNCRRASNASTLAIVTLLLAITACSDDPTTPTPVVSEPTTPQPPATPGAYVVPPTAGKVPFPGHNPTYSQSQYDALVSGITFANTFGGYEGSGDGTPPFPESRVTDWIHPGRDFMMPDGTHAFSIAAGIVRHATRWGIDIEDADNPGYGWSYGHVNPVSSLQVGDRVYQGQYIGLVEDEHVCLVRVMLRTNGTWPGDLLGLHLDDYFDLPDTLPPEIHGPLHYFQDASQVEILRTDTPVLSGQVDIVAALRDLWGRPHPGIPERMAPAEFHLGVRDDQGTTHWTHEADMRLYAVPLPFFSPPEDVDHAVNLFFKRASLFTTEYWGLSGFMYFTVTNLPTHDSVAPITARDDQLHWDTTLIPNGRYSVLLTVIDASGNTLEVSDEVEVAN